MEIDHLKGIGLKTKSYLNEQQIFTISDLVQYLPRKYNLYEVKEEDLFTGEKVCVLASIASSIFAKKIKYINCLIFTVIISGKKIKCLLFGQSYLRFKLKKDTKVILYGFYKEEQKSFIISTLFFDLFSTKIETDYRLKSIPNSTFRRFISLGLTHGEQLYDDLPPMYIEKYKFYQGYEYYYNSHFPKNREMIFQIERRKKYEEFFWYALGLEILRLSKEKKFKQAKNIRVAEIKTFIQGLPFTLTEEQKIVLNEILADLKSKEIMNRLLQGDVGSGKTIVAIIVALAVILDDYQVVFMAPTESLATQHYQTLQNFLGNISISLLTSQTKKTDKDKQLKAISRGEISFIIGTHALIEDTVLFRNLGLVIIDEQQKFGVAQRAKLLAKGENLDALYLTATPIPRTLGFLDFGDLKISSIRTKPKGNHNILTRTLSFSEMNLAFESIRKALEKGHQAYVIVPFIEESTMVDGIDITQAEEIICKQFKNNNVGVLHGKIKANQKQTIMNQFKNHEIDILISTTVIEVGIDVENATVMMILNANRFGLSQLHQLRGRIGRNSFQNQCFLIASTKECERLTILEHCNDGFELSNEDFRLRGPGDFLGEEQSGFLSMEFANVLADGKIWACAKEDAKEYYHKYTLEGIHNPKVEKIIAKVTLENSIIH